MERVLQVLISVLFLIIIIIAQQPGTYSLIPRLIEIISILFVNRQLWKTM